MANKISALIRYRTRAGFPHTPRAARCERKEGRGSRGCAEGAGKVAVWCGTPGGDRLRRMTRWIVTLAGSEADLDQLAGWPDGDDWRIIRHEKRGVVLCGERFEALDDHDSLRRAAEDLIKHLNRAARLRLPDFQGVTLGGTVDQGQGGDHLLPLGHDAVHVHMAAKATVHAHVRLDAAITDPLTQSNTPQPGADYVRLVALLEADRHLVAALDYIQDGDDWDNTWKAFEAVRKIIGGQQALRDTRWCSRRALNRFTQSAQPDRHHDWPEVDQSMTEAEGRAFVLNLLEKLIASREKRAPQ